MSKNFELLRGAQKYVLEPRLSPIPASPVPLPDAPLDNRSEWIHALHVIWKHRWLSFWFGISVLGLVIVVTAVMRPVYEPTATLEVSPPGTEAFSIQSGYSLNTDSEYLETQSKNLKSDLLAIRVIRELHLDQNPDFMGNGVLGKLIGTVLWPFSKLSSKLGMRTPAATVGGNIPAEIPSLTGAESCALLVFQDRLKVKRDVASRLIQVSFASHDPQLSAVVLSALIKEFVDSTYENRHKAVAQSSEWLSKQLEDVRKRMEDSNRALATFQKTTGIADVDTNKSTISEQMAEQSHQLTQAKTEAIVLEAYLNRVRNNNPELLPQMGSDPVVQQLVEKLAQARADLAQAKAIYGNKHPLVNRLQNQVQQFEHELNAQRSGILAQLKTSYAVAEAKKGLVSAQMRDTSHQMTQLAEYSNLKREAQANAELFNSLFAKVKEAGIAAEAKSSNVQLTSPARVLDAPTRPNWPMNLGFGFLAAVAGGVLIPFLLEKLDNRVYGTEEIQGKLATANVSIIPALDHIDGKFAAWGHALARKSEPGSRSKFIIERPHSIEAEAVRGLYTSIVLSNPNRKPEILLVVSPLPGEGKTTVAMNLAIALSGHGKTCIVDADLRHSCVARGLKLPENSGLAGVLTGEATLNDALTALPDVPGLTVLCGGPTPHDPAKLILSDQMREIITGLRQRNDFVVMDSPPVLSFSDSRTLSTLADKIVFVTRFGTTTFEAINRSLELLRSAHGAPITEVVLNAADISSLPYRYMYGYNTA
jgi:polysaccharide biosynthesis transport protein